MGTYYNVRRGDCLSSISAQFGFSDYESIYLHPENAAFREKRPNPNIICSGDVLFIPDPTIREVPCATERKHRFVLKRPKALLRLCLKDDLQKPYKNTKYHLRIDCNQYDGSTDGAGMVERKIPANATNGEITIFPSGSDDGYTFTLNLGDLDPVDETTGVDARLRNLGFGPPDSSDEELSDEDRQEALRAFQERFGLEVTGKADDATRAKLRQLHDNE